MSDYPLYHRISKNTHVETKKENFSTNFFYFAFFSKLVFWVSKTSFPPLFSTILSPIGLKIFLVRLQVIWVERFFFSLDTLYQSSLAGFAKFLGSKKSRELSKCSVFWFSSLKYLEFLKKKKNVHPDWVRLPTVKISAPADEICGFAGGKTFCKFLTLESLEVHEDDVWQICVYENFCSTARGLSTLKVSEIFVQPFLRNAGKGGCPLKINISFLKIVINAELCYKIEFL
jgi:hypothetical protein